MGCTVSVVLLGRESQVSCTVPRAAPPRRGRAPGWRASRSSRRSPRWPRRSSAAPAGASLTAVGPVNPATGFPDWYQDAHGPPAPALPRRSAGLLGLGGRRGPRAARRRGVLVARHGRPEVGQPQREARPGAGGRVRRRRPDRVRACARHDHRRPAATRRTRSNHPYGTLTVTTDANGDGRSADRRHRLRRGAVRASPPRWAAKSGRSCTGTRRSPPAPAAGYIGDAATPHRVVGSPTGFNVFALSGGG